MYYLLMIHIEDGYQGKITRTPFVNLSAEYDTETQGRP